MITVMNISLPTVIDDRLHQLPGVMDTIVKEVDMDKKQYFEQLLGKEKAEEFLARTTVKKEELVDLLLKREHAKVLEILK